MNKSTAQLIRTMAYVILELAESLEEIVGPKEEAAVKAFDEALAKVQAWAEAEDETDAAALNERTRRLNALLPNSNRPQPGEVVDQFGNVVPQQNLTVGPDSPEVRNGTDVNGEPVPARTDGGITPGPTETTEGGAAPVASTESQNSGPNTDVDETDGQRDAEQKRDLN